MLIVCLLHTLLPYHWLAGWLAGRLMSPFNTKIGYYQVQGLGWRFCYSTRLRMANDTVTSQARCLFCSATTQNGTVQRRLIYVIKW